MPGLVTLPEPWAGYLLGWFAETSLVASALALFAAIAGRCRWIAPGPAARHVLWLLVILKLVTPPLVRWEWSFTSVAGPAAVAVEGPGVGPDRPEATSGPTRPVEAAEPTTAAGRPHPDPGQPRAILAPSPAWWLGLPMAWLVGSIAITLGQARRVVRFRRLLGRATEAPLWLSEESEEVGRRLGVRVPPIRVVPGLGTPLLWCLGPPLLLVPSGLLKTLESDRWRSIVAHELAHLRRGDHWVRRLELVAGLAWWWNPVYWLARRRLDFEAELACDAWAVWVLPEGRFSYAESLIRICANLSGAHAPTPALGVAGTGRSFERRLTMILQGRVDRRASAPTLLIATALAALGLPAWTLAGPEKPTIEVKVEAGDPAVVETIESIVSFLDDDDASQADKEKASKAKAKAEKMADEMEAKFGPDSEFARKMEALGKEMEAKFGPDSEFAKKMEALGKEMEAKFGPDSPFAKEIEAKFGPDSKFAKDMEAKFGADIQPRKNSTDLTKEGALEDAKKLRLKAKVDSDVASRVYNEYKKRMAEQTRLDSDRAKRKAEAKPKADARPKPESDRKARRIENLEAKINALMDELKQLKAEGASEEDD